MKFSQRQDITPSSKEIQLDNMDKELKNGLWNVFKMQFFSKVNGSFIPGSISPTDHFIISLWKDFYKETIDKIPNYSFEYESTIKRWFFKAQWYEVYDFLEYCVHFLDSPTYSPRIDINQSIELFNLMLDRERSGYRFINKYLIPITNTYEINEITESFNVSNQFSALKGCKIHLESASQKLSDRKNPDYRNSIKESISAVESLVKLIADNDTNTLGKALKKLDSKIHIHPSLVGGFSSIYGYTNDEGGIRHALMDSPNCDFEDAKFMLISCSAFINYLIVKANKAGIEFS